MKRFRRIDDQARKCCIADDSMYRVDGKEFNKLWLLCLPYVKTVFRRMEKEWPSYNLDYYRDEFVGEVRVAAYSFLVKYGSVNRTYSFSDSLRMITFEKKSRICRDILSPKKKLGYLKIVSLDELTGEGVWVNDNDIADPYSSIDFINDTVDIPDSVMSICKRLLGGESVSAVAAKNNMHPQSMFNYLRRELTSWV